MSDQWLEWEERSDHWVLLFKQHYPTYNRSIYVAGCERKRKPEAWLAIENNDIEPIYYNSVQAAKKDLYQICEEYYLGV